MKNMLKEKIKTEWDKRIRFLEMVAGPGMLNDWEWDFVAHMEAIRGYGYDLSIKQSFKLGQIFHKFEEKLG